MSKADAIVLTVTGMTCDGCVRTVKKLAEKADPGADIEVTLASGRVEIRSGTPADRFVAAIEAGGFGVEAG